MRFHGAGFRGDDMLLFCLEGFGHVEFIHKHGFCFHFVRRGIPHGKKKPLLCDRLRFQRHSADYNVEHGERARHKVFAYGRLLRRFFCNGCLRLRELDFDEKKAKCVRRGGRIFFV